jgi:hypothetical protein
MKLKLILTAGLATMIALPAVAESMGGGASIGNGISGGSPTVPPGTSTNGPATGTNGNAVPEVPGRTLPAPSSTGAAMSIQQKLSAQGYKDVQPASNGDDAVSGQTRFRATDPQGRKVILTVDTSSGTVVNQQPEM